MSAVRELAQITVPHGQEAAFEEAMGRARHVIARSPGFRSFELLRGVERPEVYTLLVDWDTLEDHTETFRGSQLFVEWRSHIGRYFAQEPFVEHAAVVALVGAA